MKSAARQGADRLHFTLMERLSDRLSSMPAELVEHSYSPSAFGSWHSIFRCRGARYRLVLDGKERRLVLERSAKPTPPDVWIEAGARELGESPDVEAIEQGIADLLEGLR